MDAISLIALAKAGKVGDIGAAVEAAQAAQAAAELAQGAAEDAAEEAEQTLADKANKDGYYQDMSVGNAEQLISSVKIEDRTPYNFRVSGGGVDVGDRKYVKLVGGTVAWNQLVDDEGTDVTIPSGHKYFSSIGGVKTIGVSDGNAITGLTGGTDMIVDLTYMFGPTIADYVYNLADGVAWYKALFPKDYYAYNAGKFMSVKTSAQKTVGFNAYKHTAGTAKLVGGNEYQINGTYSSVSYIDVNGNPETLTIDADGKFTPTNNGTLTVTDGNATDTCVHLVWDGERDGEYEEYVEHVYALDGDIELRGLLMLDAGGKLYYDGDTYESDGTVTRDFFEYTFTGEESAGAYGQGFYVTINRQGVGAFFAGLRKSTDGNDFYTASVTDIFYTSNSSTGKIAFKITGVTSAQGLQAYLAGKTMLFKTSSPTTETADPFQDPQVVDDWGTEEYVDDRDVQIPVGHVTKYTPNLRAKLEMAPNSPPSNGKFVVEHNNGINTYVPLPSELPAVPSSDGEFRLKCTVADGVATYSWEEVQV